jgi:thioredoxin reductase
VAGGRLELLLQSQLREVGERTVRLQTPGGERELPNDYVFVFAGGVPPTEFLEKIGVKVGPHDLTDEAAREARVARAAV